MISKAASIAATADIFVVIGTSLLVYPAAGLVNYAPHGIPKFVIDKVIPEIHFISNVTAIEKPATEGVKELQQLLSKG